MRSASLVDFAEPEPEGACMTFGKHRGVPLAQITDSSYLEWVLGADRITPDLKAAITAELSTRAPKVKVQDRWRAPAGIPKHTIQMARVLVEAGEEVLGMAMDDQAVRGARVLLMKCLDDIELESDPGTLKPF